MRIFMLVQHPGAEGPTPRLAAQLVLALRSLECEVVTHPWGQRGSNESLLTKLGRRPRDVLAIRHVLRDGRFDVVVVNTSHDWRTLVRDIPLVAAIRIWRPTVLQLHGSQAAQLAGPGGRLFKAATRLLLTMADAVMVLSREEQDQWQLFQQATPVFTVKNPYARAFPAHPEPDGDASRPHRILFVGRLIEEKGIFELVDALPSVLEQTECELVLVGEGDQSHELRERVRRLGLDSHVTLTGYLQGPALTDEYRNATIFALPTSWDEGFPTVLSEAMDAGLPIVTTRIRGAADHLVPGENALFVPPRDARALASALTNLLGDGDLRARMVAANRARVEMFEPRAVAVEYLDVLKTVVGDRPAK